LGAWKKIRISANVHLFDPYLIVVKARNRLDLVVQGELDYQSHNEGSSKGNHDTNGWFVIYCSKTKTGKKV
jgi:hypothetical protein